MNHVSLVALLNNWKIFSTHVTVLVFLLHEDYEDVRYNRAQHFLPLLLATCNFFLMEKYFTPETLLSQRAHCHYQQLWSLNQSVGCQLRQPRRVTNHFCFDFCKFRFRFAFCFYNVCCSFVFRKFRFCFAFFDVRFCFCFGFGKSRFYFLFLICWFLFPFLFLFSVMFYGFFIFVFVSFFSFLFSIWFLFSSLFLQLLCLVFIVIFF